MKIDRLKGILNVYRTKVRNLFSRPAVVFYYHRVASVSDDPHLLSVSPENFEKQLITLRDTFRIIRLADLVQKMKGGENIHGLAVITFDDGYIDNLTTALPILRKLNIPATFFITTGNIGSAEPFYWDTGTGMKDRGRAMTENELKTLAINSLVDIGAHTVNHPHLSSLSIERQRHEIENSKKILETILGKSVNLFSYPFGGKTDFDQQTMRLVEQAGFECAVTTFKKSINRNTSLFAIPRRVVRNLNTEEFKKYIHNI